MERNTANGESGSLLIGVIVAVSLLSVSMFIAVEMRETQLQREWEEELIFRGHQYVRAIEHYQKKHPNVPPRNLEILHLEKCIRRLYKDPMTDHGRWNLVFRVSGREKLVVSSPEAAGDLFSRGVLVGVCSASPEAAFKIYRGKKKYNEWAFYVGEKENSEMPELEFVQEKK